MSASAKKPAFPLNCANGECGKALCGPVLFCPYCGASSQVVTSAPVAAPAAVAAAVVASETPTAPAPVAKAPEPPRQVTISSAEIERAVAATAPPQAPVVAQVSKPRNVARQAALAIAVLVAVGGYAAYQMNARKALQQFEAELAAGQGCLRLNQYNCALEKAESALRIESKDPRAISLLQRAQAGLEGQQRDQQAQAQAAAAAASAAATRKAAAEQAQREQQARELAAKEQQLHDEQTQLAKRQQQLEQQARSAPPVQPRVAPVARPVQRPVAPAANAGLVGQQLSQARSALARRDGATARSLANRVLSQDPGNRQAQIILRQAEQLRGQSFNTPKGLGGVIIE
ncbi:hypothetical protein LOY54_00505 [Pseudomonas sp. B21-032]|uniref:hypothetical protein n=1 Tax=unclassified Pseudomonas TaxID=196821 RepID=UPI0005EBBC5B|nr:MULTISPECIES: hypothetical protein [unclassified Pseudomonas]KJK15476.1 hypothetical protein UB48_21050 [Pseudomonas sp. 2(2015)]QVM96645.1 hypothetical protein JYG36_00185 [Pseudomonas sp. SORT22]UVL56492.1 hypothetical protein LOY22_00505 [Pseudomonas sp. B21-035]UVL61782.1 hypothetical protein LOY54_00505 [Pseudomonas sp. B21-032]SDQ24242.1 hypothetical protein SAMN05216487_0538 [Pseudomonas sp. UC 17F4]